MKKNRVFYGLKSYPKFSPIQNFCEPFYFPSCPKHKNYIPSTSIKNVVENPHTLPDTFLAKIKAFVLYLRWREPRGTCVDCRLWWPRCRRLPRRRGESGSGESYQSDYCSSTGEVEANSCIPACFAVYCKHSHKLEAFKAACHTVMLRSRNDKVSVAN